MNFSISSQTFGSDEKAIIFPITNDKGKVISLWGGIVNKERDYLKFYYLQNSSDAVQNIINAFQNCITTEIANKKHVIDEIVIFVPQSHLELPDWWFDYSFPGETPSGGGGGAGVEMSGDGGLYQGGGGYTGNNTDPSNTNPCDKAKIPSSIATANSKDTAFSNAKTAVTGMNNGKENGVVLGNVNGTIQSTEIQTGGITSIGNLTSNFSNPIGDLHNHPNNNPPSPGDFYSLINARNQYSNYNTRYVITEDGTTYGLVATDPTVMNTFLQIIRLL